MSGDINYESSLHQSVFKEKITYHNQTYMVHHVLYMISKQELIALAKRCHFKCIHEYTYSHHYIVVFQREIPIYDNIP